MDTTTGTRPREETTTDRIVAGLAEWICSNDPEVVVEAIGLLAEIGPPAVPGLIKKAAGHSTSIGDQYRLLDLACRIGGQRGPEENRHLRSLRRHWCRPVREKVEQILTSMPPRRRSRKASVRNPVRDAGAPATEIARAEESGRIETGATGNPTNQASASGELTVPTDRLSTA